MMTVMTMKKCQLQIKHFCKKKETVQQPRSDIRLEDEVVNLEANNSAGSPFLEHS